MACPCDKIKLNRKQDRRARFTDEEVNEMRELYAKGWTQKVIAEHYETHQSTVSYIVSEYAHEHLAEYRKVNPPKRRTAEEAKLYMRDLRKYKRSLLKAVNDMVVKFPTDCSKKNCPHFKYWESGIAEITCCCDLYGVERDADDETLLSCSLSEKGGAE